MEEIDEHTLPPHLIHAVITTLHEEVEVLCLFTDSSSTLLVSYSHGERTLLIHSTGFFVDFGRKCTRVYILLIIRGVWNLSRWQNTHDTLIKVPNKENLERHLFVFLKNFNLFCFASLLRNKIENLKSQGLILGGSLRNAVLVDGDRIVNEEGLRYDNEFVRHKVLDCLGDLSLAGVQIIGHLYAYKPGHQLNTAVVKEVFEQRDAWSYLAVDELDMLLGRGEIPEAPSDSSEANDLLAGKG